MTGNSNRFIYGFLILFLSMLLLIFVIFAVAVHYDPDTQTSRSPSSASGEEREASEVRKNSFSDLTPLYRANLFAIDLCLVVLAETLLIILFVKFAIPATVLATVIIIFMTMNASQKLRNELIPGLLSRFVTNRYATLSHTDMVLLVLLSGLIMAFLMSVLLKQPGVKTQGSEFQKPTPQPPFAPSSPE